jgi:hypothetical protein
MSPFAAPRQQFARFVHEQQRRRPGKQEEPLPKRETGRVKIFCRNGT